MSQLSIPFGGGGGRNQPKRDSHQGGDLLPEAAASVEQGACACRQCDCSSDDLVGLVVQGLPGAQHVQQVVEAPLRHTPDDEFTPLEQQASATHTPRGRRARQAWGWQGKVKCQRGSKTNLLTPIYSQPMGTYILEYFIAVVPKRFTVPYPLQTFNLQLRTPPV